MSKKDFDDYYNSICNQREQLIQELEELQRIANERMIEPERLENMKKTFQPILDTYQMVSWVAFLLNKPTRTRKSAKYEKMLEKKTSKLNSAFSKDGLLKRNDNILKNLHSSIQGD